jgi:predicted dehydrogenase
MVTLELAMPFEPNPTSRQFSRGAGGGALLDLGIYGLSLAHLFMGGAPTHVHSHALVGALGVDEQAAVLLAFEGGREAVVTTSLRGQGRNEALLVGTEGSLRLHAPLYCPERYTLSHTPVIRPGGTRTPGRLATLRHHRLVRPVVEELKARLPRRTSEKTVTLRPSGNGYAEQAAEVMRCLRAGHLESPLLPLSESIAVLETADRARATWTGGAP